MADDDGGRGLERIEQADEVADQMKDRVLIDRLGCVALAVTAHVGGHGVEARRGEGANLMAPGIPGFGKAVAEQHQRSLALLGDVEADAVALDRSLGRFAHVFFLAPRRLRKGVCERLGMKDVQRGPRNSGNTTALRERRLSMAASICRPGQAVFAINSPWPSRTNVSNVLGLAPPSFSIVSVTAKRARSGSRPAARSAFQSAERCSSACAL